MEQGTARCIKPYMGVGWVCESGHRFSDLITCSHALTTSSIPIDDSGSQYPLPSNIESDPRYHRTSQALEARSSAFPLSVGPPVAITQSPKPEPSDATGYTHRAKCPLALGLAQQHPNLAEPMGTLAQQSQLPRVLRRMTTFHWWS